MMVEASCGRFVVALPQGDNGLLMNCSRVLSSCYQERISMLATKMSYRNAVLVFNTMTGRSGTKDEIPLSTFNDDIEYIGTNLIQYKKDCAKEILTTYKFSPDTGLYTDSIFPEEYRTAVHKSITIVPSEIMGYTEEEFSRKYLVPMPLSSGYGKEVFSKPDMEVYPIVKTRRSSRKTLLPDTIKDTCHQYVLRNNNKERDVNKWILHPCELEIDSTEVLYISIDAVLVPEQSESRVKNGKCQLKEKKTFISHWNIRLEYGTQRYSVTSTDKEEVYKEILAVILNNKLYNKYMVFFTDGEKCIFEDIGRFFHNWKHSIYLDWFHLQEKVFSLMTMIIHAERVIDPHGKTEYYKTGSKKGEVKSQEKTSLSRLYARELCLILWYGNTDEAVFYLNHLDPDVVKSEYWLNELISYIENKKQWITCYALRKRAGLRNSSNGVENQNMITVSKRQKKRGMSWREHGSSVVAALTALFDNNEAKAWFYKRQFSFVLNTNAPE